MADGNFDYKKAIAEAKETGVARDMTQDSGESGFTPIREGIVGIRLVEYIEIGKHEKKVKGDVKVNDQAILGFEVSGKGIEKNDDGKYPIIRITETVSSHEKATMRKLFNRMNYAGDATSMPELLDGAYRGRIFHNTTGEGDDKRTYTNLYDADRNWSLTGPWRESEDDDTGQIIRTPVAVEERTNPIRIFLWKAGSKGMWDTLFIDGMHEEKRDDKGNVTREASSKNWIQEKIKKAKNYAGSPIQVLLAAGGEEVDVGEPDKVERKDEDKQASVEQKANNGARDPLDD